MCLLECATCTDVIELLNSCFNTHLKCIGPKVLLLQQMCLPECATCTDVIEHLQQTTHVVHLSKSIITTTSMLT